MNVPFAGQAVRVPYVSASIVLDGADIPLFHLVQEIEASDARMGMRVEAVWAPREELAATMESIRYFRPSGEPDAPFESYREHL